MRAGRTLTTTAAVAAALFATSAGAASAHHCYKDHWADAAYQHHAQGGTAWVPLSTLGQLYIVPPDLQELCPDAGDEAVAAYMANHGLSQEPLIHSKATTGGGAADKRGFEPKPFSYLGESDFMELELLLWERLDECTGGLEEL